jgi:hypothetical protein
MAAEIGPANHGLVASLNLCDQARSVSRSFILSAISSHE